MSTKNKNCVIVIPQHRAIPKWNEDISLRRCKDVFYEYDVVMAHPEGMDTSAYEKYGIIKRYIPMKARYFSSDILYNRMMNTPYFYKHFLNYEYMLLYQLDTFVFENNLDEWCDMGYTYIGAPWVEATWIKKLKKKNIMDR